MLQNTTSRSSQLTRCQVLYPPRSDLIHVPHNTLTSPQANQNNADAVMLMVMLNTPATVEKHPRLPLLVIKNLSLNTKLFN